MYQKRTIHWVALIVGIGAAFVEGLSNIDDIAHKVGTLWNPAVFAAAITSVGAAVLLAFVIKAFKQRHMFVGAGLLLTLLFTAGYTISTTLTRTSETRAVTLQKVFEADPAYREMFNLYKSSASRSASECGQGAGVKCNNNTAHTILALGKLKDREAELDAMGRQVQWAFAMIGVNISIDTAGRIQPMFLPMALFLLGMMSIAFGENGEWVEPEFKTELTGKAAEIDKARRYIQKYEADNGTKPSPQELAEVVSISEFRARGILRKNA